MTNPTEPGKEKPPHSLVTREGFGKFIKEHKWESCAYFFLFCGLILSIFCPIWGGLLVGFILGIYFSKNIFESAREFKEFIDREGIFRGFIVIAAVIALLILAFGLCVGTAVGAFIRPYLPFDEKA